MYSFVLITHRGIPLLSELKIKGGGSVANMHRTLVLVKPDGVQRGLTGEVISRLEQRGLKLVGMKLMHIGQKLAERHYSAHVEKDFYPGLISFITSGPVVAIVVEGENAVTAVRQTIGDTDPLKAAPGTLRSEFGLDIGRNLVHGSDTIEAARHEVDLFFQGEELVVWTKAIQDWVTES